MLLSRTAAVLLAAALLAAPARAQLSAADACEDPFTEARPLAFDPGGWATDFCQHSVPYGEIKSGGPPRDGIPPLDDPQHVSTPAADMWLADEEPVILVEKNGAVRAYPLQVLIWHEIANDRLGGAPVTVTFCPLCYAAVAFERPAVGGDTLTFGTTGNLRKSDLVMWDRQTESWWQQFTGTAIVGALTGRELTPIPAQIVAWKTFRERYPEATVLSRETGHDRPYGQNPYAGYDDVDKTPLMYDGPVGDALPPMARVVGVEAGGASRAYPLERLREEAPVNDTVGGVPLVVFWEEGMASAMDAQRIAGSRDIGATGAFRREAGGRALTFRSGPDGRFVDEETGSTWTVLGEAVAGPLDGQTLQPVPHHDVFWFVWSAFQPEASVYGDER